MKARLFTAVVIGLLTLAGCQLPLFNTAQTERQSLLGEIAKRQSLGEQKNRSSESAIADASSTQQRPNSYQSQTTANVLAAAQNSTVSELLNRGQAEAIAGRMQQAKASYLAVLQKEPKHPFAHHRLAIISDQENDFEAAERHYRAAIDGKPRDANLWSDLGYSYYLQNRYQESTQALQEALQINPSHQRALNNYGLVLGSQGKYDEALAIFRRDRSEQEAQAKLAKLLSRVPSQIQQAGVQQKSTFNQYSARRDQNSARPSSQNSTMQQPPPFAAMKTTPRAYSNGNQSSGDITQQLKAMMERERLQSVAARNRRQFRSQSSTGGLTRSVGTLSAAKPNSFGPAVTQNAVSGFANTPWPHTNATSPQQFRQVAAPSGPPPTGTPSLPPQNTAGGFSNWSGTNQHAGQMGTSQTAAAPIAANVWPPEQTNRNQHVSSQYPVQQTGLDTPKYQMGRPVPQQQMQNSQRAAVIMGMNAGPGGMFPMTSPQSNNRIQPTNASSQVHSQLNTAQSAAPSQFANSRYPVANPGGQFQPNASANSMYHTGTAYHAGSAAYPQQTPSPAANAHFETPASALRQGVHQAGGYQTTASQAEANMLKMYEAQIQQQNEQLNSLRQKLQSNRQLPSGTGNQLPPSGQMHLPQNFTTVPNGQAGSVPPPAYSGNLRTSSPNTGN